MVTEQFSLCWDNFHKNMSQGMQSLLENEDLVDVTLAVEGRYLKAHKMVLSVCSPYFRELFQTNPCKHPIVFMKDVSYIALSDLLQFMYQGEVQVAQENLTTFIKTAESLQIKGLTGDSNQIETDVDLEPDKPPDNFPKKYREQVETPKPALLQNAPRPKKPLAGPASKRPKLQASLKSEAGASSTSTKSEASTGAPTAQEIIQFKMEPYEQGNVEPEENQEETYGNETIDDAAQVGDDSEDFSLMETGDDEPHPGTSGDATGDGQDEKSDEKTLFRKRWCKAIEADGFTYHQNSSKNNGQIRYLVCSEYKRLVCRARAILPSHGKIEDLVVTRGHNHPPNRYSVDVTRSRFVNTLKRLICSSPGLTLRDIYIAAKEIDPEGSEVCPFHKIVNSMRRWKNISLKGGSSLENIALNNEAMIKIEVSRKTDYQ